MDKEIEIWKTIPGFDLYEISSSQRIRSKETIVRTKDKTNKWTTRKCISRQIKTYIGTNGYRYFCARDNRKIAVHIAFWLAFRGEKKGLNLNHKDGNKLNNSLDNLELVTQRENCIHAVMTGLHTRTVNEFLNKSDVLLIRFFGVSTESNKILAKLYRRDISTIRNIVARRCYNFY